MNTSTFVLLVLVAVAAVSATFTEEEYRTSWAEWKAEHGKSYDVHEEKYRFRVFSQNMDFVDRHNSEGHSFTVALNKFADLTNTEFRERYGGLRRNKIDLAPVPEAETVTEVARDVMSSPVDWVKAGAVTPVKDQGQCGSCWSFSTTGSVEGAWYLKNRQLVSLSEQNLMDCSWSYGNLACNGGLMDSAFKYIIDNNGIDTEASYPYQEKSSFDCQYSSKNKGASISKYVDVKPYSESSLQAAVNSTPVSVAIDASQRSFQFYKSGVYYEPNCSSYSLDHGVLAVGWGTDVTTGEDYWYVKNSWGTGWGDSGFIFMARNKNNNCGIASEASYPIV